MIDVIYLLTMYGIPTAVFAIWAMVLFLGQGNPGPILIDIGPAVDERLVFALGGVTIVGLYVLAPMPWNSSQPGLAFAGLFLAVASIAAFCAVLLRSRIQITKRGIMSSKGMIRWEQIGYCGWSDNGELMLRVRGSFGASTSRIQLAGRRREIEPILQEYLSEDVYPRIPDPNDVLEER